MMTATFNFEIYRERCLSLFKEIFLMEFKKNNNCSFDTIFDLCMTEMGLPLNCPLQTDLKEWFDKVYNQSYLKKAIQKNHLAEIIVHSHKKIQIQSNCREYQDIDHLTEDDYQLSLEILAAKNNQNWNNSNPFASFQGLINNQLFRISINHFSTSPEKKSKAFLRKLNTEHFPLENFTKSQATHSLLEKLIKQHANIVICGGTGSGKTSLLRTLTTFIDRDEHIITIEDTHELLLNRTEQTSFIAGETPENSMKSYCKYSLRMKPDRILVGEIRGEEVVPFLLSANSGHKGMMSSIHANSAIDCLSRLSLLFQIYADQKGIDYQQVLKLICDSLDYIIYMNDREVTEIIKVLGCEGHSPYFEALHDTMQ